MGGLKITRLQRMMKLFNTREIHHQEHFPNHLKNHETALGASLQGHLSGECRFKGSIKTWIAHWLICNFFEVLISRAVYKNIRNHRAHKFCVLYTIIFRTNFLSLKSWLGKFYFPKITLYGVPYYRAHKVFPKITTFCGLLYFYF